MPAADARSPTRRPLRVVIVDDSSDFRAMLRVVLRRHPRFEVVAEARDGTSGLQAVRHHRPDLVLTDLQMPGADGLALTRTIRVLDDRVPIVMLTGLSCDGIGAVATAAGVDLVIEKAAGMSRLLPALEQVLEGGRAATSG